MLNNTAEPFLIWREQFKLFIFLLLFNPPFSEGLLITCSYDYLSEDWMKKSFVLYAFIGNYCIPMLCAIYFYSRIVVAVVKHEANLRKQAKKMNVDSLRAGDQVPTMSSKCLFMISLSHADGSKSRQ